MVCVQYSKQLLSEPDLGVQGIYYINFVACKNNFMPGAPLLTQFLLTQSPLTQFSPVLLFCVMRFFLSRKMRVMWEPLFVLTKNKIKYKNYFKNNFIPLRHACQWVPKKNDTNNILTFLRLHACLLALLSSIE